MKEKPDFFQSATCLLITECGLIVAAPTCSSHSLLQAAPALHFLAPASLQRQAAPHLCAHPHVQFIPLAITHTYNISTKLSTALHRD